MKAHNNPQRWWFLASFVVFAATAFWPGSGWIARYELRSLVQQPSNVRFESDVHNYLAAHPTDYPMRLIDVLQDASTIHVSLSARDAASRQQVQSGFDRLVKDFPSNPSAYANALDIESSFLHAIEWRAKEDVDSGGNPVSDTTDWPLPDDATQAFLRDYIKLGLVGERLDPNNAYFPWKLAGAYYSLHQDNLAIASLEKANEDTAWTQYFADFERGLWREFDIVDGGMNGTDFYTIKIRFDFDGVTVDRSLVRMAIWEASQCEKNGRIVQGLSIRHSVMHVASLMRYEGTVYVCSLNAPSLFAICESRPGGVKAHWKRVASANVDDERLDVLIDTQLHRLEPAYKAYLLRHGFSAESLWVSRETQAQAAMVAACDIDDSLPGKTVAKSDDLFARLVFDSELQVVTWIALGWIFSSLGVRAVVLLMAVVIGTSNREPKLFTLVGATILFVVTFAGLWASVNGAMSAINLYKEISMPSPVVQTTDTGSLLLLVAAISLPLLLFASVVVAIALIRKLPALETLQNSGQHIIGPLLLLVTLVYFGAVFAQNVQDQEFRNENAEIIKIGEAQYYAKLNGKPWPGLTPEPKLTLVPVDVNMDMCK